MSFLEYNFTGISFPKANALDPKKPFRLIVERYFGPKPVPLEASLQKFTFKLHPDPVFHEEVLPDLNSQLARCSGGNGILTAPDDSIQIISDSESRRVTNVVSPHKDSGNEVDTDSIVASNLNIPDSHLNLELINDTAFLANCCTSFFGNDLSCLLSSTVRCPVESDQSLVPARPSLASVHFYIENGPTPPIEHETDGTQLPPDIMKFILTNEKYHNPNGESILSIEAAPVSLTEESVMILDQTDKQISSHNNEDESRFDPPDLMETQPSFPNDQQPLCENEIISDLPTPPSSVDFNPAKSSDDFNCASDVNCDALAPVENDQFKPENNFFYDLDLLLDSDQGSNNFSDSDLSLDLDSQPTSSDDTSDDEKLEKDRPMDESLVSFSPSPRVTNNRKNKLLNDKLLHLQTKVHVLRLPDSMNMNARKLDKFISRLNKNLFKDHIDFIHHHKPKFDSTSDPENDSAEESFSFNTKFKMFNNPKMPLNAIDFDTESYESSNDDAESQRRGKRVSKVSSDKRKRQRVLTAFSDETSDYDLSDGNVTEVKLNDDDTTTEIEGSIDDDNKDKDSNLEAIDDHGDENAENRKTNDSDKMSETMEEVSFVPKPKKRQRLEETELSSDQDEEEKVEEKEKGKETEKEDEEKAKEKEKEKDEEKVIDAYVAPEQVTEKDEVVDMFIIPDKVSEKTEVTVALNTKRKNIRQVISEEELEIETKEATCAERKRIEKITEQEKVYNRILPGIRKKRQEPDLILDINGDTKEVRVEVTSVLMKEFKTHQMEGIKFMYNCVIGSVDQLEEEGSGCILAHCMGLGKTLQVIALVHTLLSNRFTADHTKTILIVVPVNTLKNWAEEFDKWITQRGLKTFKVHEIVNDISMKKRLHRLKLWKRVGGVLIIGQTLLSNLLTLCFKNRSNVDESTIEEFVELLANPGPDIVVIDEGHQLKSENNSICYAISRIQTARKIILTGTPLQNNLYEYFNMVNIIKPRLLGSKKEFANRFANPIENGQKADSNEDDVKLMKQRATVLHQLLAGCVQRFDAETLKPFLQPKLEYVIFIRPSERVAEMYNFYLDNITNRNPVRNAITLRACCNHPVILSLKKVTDTGKREDIKGQQKVIRVEKDSSKPNETISDQLTNNQTFSIPEEICTDDVLETGDDQEPEDTSLKSDWYKQFVQPTEWSNIELSCKFIMLFKILKRCIVAGDKLVVASQSIETLNLIEKYLPFNKQVEMEGSIVNLNWKSNRNYFRIDGSINADNRLDQVKKFNDPKNTDARLFLLSTKAGGVGINLVGANRCVIFDVSWNPSVDTQAIFRIFRLGQRKPVYVYRFVTKDTMEEKIFRKQIVKLGMSIRVVDQHQIKRVFKASELAEFYNTRPKKEYDISLTDVPSDSLLADILHTDNKEVLEFTAFDSLLEKKPEEELTEDERQAAWAEYQKDRDAEFRAVENRRKELEAEEKRLKEEKKQKAEKEAKEAKVTSIATEETEPLKTNNKTGDKTPNLQTSTSTISQRPNGHAIIPNEPKTNSKIDETPAISKSTDPSTTIPPELKVKPLKSKNVTSHCSETSASTVKSVSSDQLPKPTSTNVVTPLYKEKESQSVHSVAPEPRAKESSSKKIPESQKSKVSTSKSSETSTSTVKSSSPEPPHKSTPTNVNRRSLSSYLSSKKKETQSVNSVSLSVVPEPKADRSPPKKVPLPPLNESDKPKVSTSKNSDSTEKSKTTPKIPSKANATESKLTVVKGTDSPLPDSKVTKPLPTEPLAKSSDPGEDCTTSKPTRKSSRISAKKSKPSEQSKVKLKPGPKPKTVNNRASIVTSKSKVESKSSSTISQTDSTKEAPSPNLSGSTNTTEPTTSSALTSQTSKTSSKAPATSKKHSKDSSKQVLTVNSSSETETVSKSDSTKVNASSKKLKTQIKDSAESTPQVVSSSATSSTKKSVLAAPSVKVRAVMKTSLPTILETSNILNKTEETVQPVADKLLSNSKTESVKKVPNSKILEPSTISLDLLSQSKPYAKKRSMSRKELKNLLQSHSQRQMLQTETPVKATPPVKSTRASDVASAPDCAPKSTCIKTTSKSTQSLTSSKSQSKSNSKSLAHDQPELDLKPPETKVSASSESSKTNEKHTKVTASSNLPTSVSKQSSKSTEKSDPKKPSVASKIAPNSPAAFPETAASQTTVKTKVSSSRSTTTRSSTKSTQKPTETPPKLTTPKKAKIDVSHSTEKVQTSQTKSKLPVSCKEAEEVTNKPSQSKVSLGSKRAKSTTKSGRQVSRRATKSTK